MKNPRPLANLGDSIPGQNRLSSLFCIIYLICGRSLLYFPSFPSPWNIGIIAKRYKAHGARQSPPRRVNYTLTLSVVPVQPQNANFPFFPQRSERMKLYCPTRRVSMKRKTVFILGLVLSVAFIFASIQPALAAERIVKLRIPACG